MDPLSLAASIAGLVSLAGAVISAGYQLNSKLNEDTSDTKTLVTETANFSGILLGVKAHLESFKSLDVDLEAVHNTIEDSRLTIKLIDELLAKLSKSNRIETLIKAGGREEQAVKLLRRIEQYKTFFVLCFQLEQSSQSETLQIQMEGIVAQLQSLDETQKGVEKAVGKLVDAGQIQQQEKIIKWLGTPTEDEHDDLCKQRDASSAEWILKRQEFNSWLSCPGSALLCLNGTQGSGKSVIVSKVIESLQESTFEPGSKAVAYHYCRFTNPASLSPANLIGSLIGQLLKQSSNPGALLEIVNNIYEKHRKRSAHPSLQDLQVLFTDISNYFERVLLVIDGLDEMSGYWEILDFLETLPEADTEFKVLIASRAGMGLDDAFSSCFKITITSTDVACDIESLVRKKLNKRRFRGSEVEAVIKELILRADGMKVITNSHKQMLTVCLHRFIWVICQIDHLSRVRTALSPKLVQALPRNLEKTFEQAFQTLEDEEEKKLAKRILQFVMFANRPLDLSELVEGIAITPDSKTLEDVQSNSLREKSYVFEICGSLVRESQATSKIDLAHYSVYQFLQSPKIEGNRENELYLDKSHGNIELLTACIRYLTIENVSAGGIAEEVEAALEDDDLYISPEVFANTPFLQHAVSNWPAYASKLSDTELKDIWTSVLLPFFEPSSNYFKFWVRKARYLHGYYKYPPGITPLHVAAAHGLPSLAKILLEDSHLSKATWQISKAKVGSRTPLHMAIENGQNSVIELLLGLDLIDSTDERGRTPLHLAIECANEEAVTKLILAGANVNHCEADGRTPLFIAIENNWDGLATQLAEMASQHTNMPDGRGPLHLAAQTGSTTWMKCLMLTSPPRAINNRDNGGWTPLLYAVDRGHLDVVKLLLSNTNCIEVGDKNGWTPLHAAIKQQNMDCTTELLVSNIPKLPFWQYRPEEPVRGMERPGPEMTGKYGEAYRSRQPATATRGGPSERWSAWEQQSSSEPHQAATVSSPLLLAVSSNYKFGVELLLRHAETYGRKEIGLLEEDGECLKASMMLTETAIFKKLIPVSTAKSILAVLPDCHEKGGVFMELMKQRLDSAFAHQQLLPEALSDGKLTLEVPHMILDNWPLQANSLPDNILHLAVQVGNDHELRLMRRLVDGGANTSYVDTDGQTLLHTAIDHLNWSATTFVIGNLPFSKDILSSALHSLVRVAPAQGREISTEIVVILKLLLYKGADVNSLDRSDRSVNHTAAGQDDTAFLEWFLENNAILAPPTSRDDTPITVAVRYRRYENLQLLLDNILETAPETLVEFLATPSTSYGTPLIQSIELSDIMSLTKLAKADKAAELLVKTDMDEYQSRRLSAFTDALCAAIKKQSDEAAMLLIKSMSNISSTSSSGETPLHAAVKEEDEKMVKVLLEHGAQLNVPHRDTGETPFAAATVANLTRIKAILSQQQVDYQPQDIIAAAKAGDEGLVAKVLAAYPDDQYNQRKALFTARKLRQKKTEKTLLEILPAQAKSSLVGGIIRNAYGDTVLHQAVRAMNPEKLKSLCSGGDKDLLDAYDLGGDSALMLAIRMCHWSGAEVLAKEGADIDEALAKSHAAKCELWIDKLNELKSRLNTDFL
ncbi:ankyrin protein [Fusarium napiforme]|uniref:Ankyrin protein n=1 Tax=Fusarium napiforme TaxID=42672 RepID=A0A8H5I9J4_9HYPO|nr:ankyrin protein [Fusarium napiforme]